MFKKSISAVLVLCSSIAILAAIAGMVIYVSQSSYDMTIKVSSHNMKQLVEGTQKSVSLYLEDSQKVTKSLAQLPSVSQALSNQDTELCQEILKKYLGIYTDYYSIFVFNKQGIMVAGVNALGQNAIGTNVTTRPYYKQLKAGNKSFFSKKIFQPKNNPEAWIFAVSHAVENESGDFIGGVVVFPKWSSFTEEFINNIRVGEHGYAFIVDDQGAVLAHGKNKQMIGQNPRDQFILDAIARKDGSTSYTFNGSDRFMTFDHVPSTDWLICITASTSELAENATLQRNVLIGIGVVVALVLVSLIVFIVRGLVVRPILSIEDFTSRIAQGDFSATLDGKFKYELAHLAENVKAMVTELKHRLGFSQGLLKGMNIPCIVIDTDQKIIFINQGLLNVLEYDGTPEQYEGMTLSRFLFNEEGHDTTTGKSIRERRAFLNIQMKTTTKKGNTVFIQNDSAPIYDFDGEIIAGFSLFTDLTEIKMQQKMIEQQNENIGQAAKDANQISIQTASGSEELAAQVEQASKGSEEQMKRTSEAATAMEEMNATVMEVATNASNAAKLADETIAKAHEGSDIVADVISTINDINSKAEELKSDMTILGEQAEGIGQIMNVISDIADQTNLLALNAAIEAARAGDAGRGFAVVADEVRKLAEKTMNATNEVAASISAIQDSTRKSINNTEDTSSQIAKSTELVEQAGTSLSEIVDMIKETADQVHSIATASEQQSAASDEITRAMDVINRISSETSDAMTQSADAVSELANLAQQLNTIIDNMTAQES